MGVISGQFLPDPTPAYAFSKPLDWLGFDPSYPKNPRTLGEYIRKFRKDKGLTMGEFAREIGVHEFTVINWEVRGKVPRFRSHIRTLKNLIPEAGRFFEG